VRARIKRFVSSRRSPVAPHTRPVVTDVAPEALLPSERLRRRATDDDVTQAHRGRAYADEGDRFEVDGATLEVVAVDSRTLGDLTDADARAGGASDLDDDRDLLARAREGFEWDDDAPVVCHRFERVDD
jgi:hypothetical protein